MNTVDKCIILQQVNRNHIPMWLLKKLVKLIISEETIKSNILQNTKNTHSFERILTSRQHINITWLQDVLVYEGIVMNYMHYV